MANHGEGLGVCLIIDMHVHRSKDMRLQVGMAALCFLRLTDVCLRIMPVIFGSKSFTGSIKMNDGKNSNTSHTSALPS